MTIDYADIGRLPPHGCLICEGEEYYFWINSQEVINDFSGHLFLKINAEMTLEMNHSFIHFLEIALPSNKEIKIKIKNREVSGRVNWVDHHIIPMGTVSVHRIKFDIFTEVGDFDSIEIKREIILITRFDLMDLE
ncbi:hypothetical protein LCGC14_1087890 [marine sediment metagenome]|uniref:Uncharacterized protein n=1 Tax=marine sediment metagenome TaxID=412755 RepID=A0A0F9MDG4_9ZZZZ